jgi:hypothetical protein
VVSKNGGHENVSDKNFQNFVCLEHHCLSVGALNGHLAGDGPYLIVENNLVP